MEDVGRTKAEYQRRYREENKARVAESKRRWYVAHRAEVLEQRRRRRKAYQAEVLEAQRRGQKARDGRPVLGRKAERRDCPNYEICLTQAALKDLEQIPCHYCENYHESTQCA